MKRPEQHDTDKAAEAIFRGVFSKWAVSASEEDYGWDFIVEFFRNRESTGRMFFGQLKGSTHTKYSADGTFISQKLEQNSADYLARQLELPTFLFHADVDKNKIFWNAIQLDANVLEAIERQTKSLFVRIPTANALPDNMQQFLADLAQVKAELTTRILLNAKPFKFAGLIATQPVERLASVAKDLHYQAFRVQLDIADNQRLTGETTAAIATLKQVIAGARPDGQIEILFNAVIRLGDLEALQLMRSDGPQADVPAKRLAVAQELCSIARRKPRHLHLYAQIDRRAADLGVTAHKAFGLMMNRYAQEKRNADPLWLMALTFQIEETLAIAHQQYRRALRLAYATTKSRFRGIASQPLVHIATVVGTLATVMDSCGLKVPAVEYRRSAFELLKFATAIAEEINAIDHVFPAVMHARILETDPNGEIIRWVRGKVDSWPEDGEQRKAGEQLLKNWHARKAGVEFDGDIKTTPRQVLYNLLTSFDIDPTAQPWAERIDLALQDEDPTRVLVDCKYKNVTYHPSADKSFARLGLESANPKLLICIRHRYGLGGPALDGLNAEFERRYCVTCPDKSPRAKGWNFYGDSVL